MASHDSVFFLKYKVIMMTAFERRIKRFFVLKRGGESSYDDGAGCVDPPLIKVVHHTLQTPFHPMLEGYLLILFLCLRKIS